METLLTRVTYKAHLAIRAPAPLSSCCHTILTKAGPIPQHRHPVYPHTEPRTARLTAKRTHATIGLRPAESSARNPTQDAPQVDLDRRLLTDHRSEITKAVDGFRTTCYNNTMTKQLQNLIDKHGAPELHRLIDAEVARRQDIERLQEIMSTPKSAKQWFMKFAKDNKLTAKECYNQTKEKTASDYNKYGKSRLALNNWRSDGPYVYLWLNRDHTPHFEMGSSIHDIWGAVGYRDSIANIKKIIGLRAQSK